MSRENDKCFIPRKQHYSFYMNIPIMPTNRINVYMSQGINSTNMLYNGKGKGYGDVMKKNRVKNHFLYLKYNNKRTVIDRNIINLRL